MVTSGAVKSAINNFIKYEIVNIPTITLGADGYVSISSYFPNVITNNLFFVTAWNYGAVSTKDAIAVEARGLWLRGHSNATVTDLTLIYFYFN